MTDIATSTDWFERRRLKDFSWHGIGAIDEHVPRHEWAGWIVLSDGTITEDPESYLLTDDRRQSGRPDGARPATLQDYWKLCFTELGIEIETFPVSPVSGKVFTPLHTPPHWEDGTPASLPEAQLAVSRKMIAWANERAGPCQWDSARNRIGPDRRAQLQGSVFQNLSAADVSSNSAPLYWLADWACFDGQTDFRSAIFGEYAQFQTACFTGKADFSEARFERYADFEEALFCGSADFRRASFLDMSDFFQTRFLGKAQFGHAQFHALADFEDCVFGAKPDFESARFLANVWLDDPDLAKGALIEGDAG